MVLPETPDTHGTKSGRRIRLISVLGALLLIAGAMIALGRLTSSPTSAEPGTPATTITTTATSVYIVPTTTATFFEQGEPLEWLELVSLNDYPIAVHDVDGRTFVYTRGELGRGAELWSNDPRYQDLPVLDSDHYIHSIIDIWFGLMAVGVEVASGAPVVWRSADGINWERTPLPNDPIRGMSIGTQGAHAATGLIVVTAQAYQPYDFDALRIEAEVPLKERFGELLENFYWFQTESGVDFSVFGPLGLILGTIPAEDLGLDPGAYTPDPGPTLQLLWVSPDGQSWQLSVDDHPAHLGDMFTGPDGGIWAVDPSHVGGALIATRDGFEWRRIPWRSETVDPVLWGDQLVGLSYQDLLVVSEDGSNWNLLEVPQALLNSPWSPDGVAAGPGSLAVVVSRFLAPATPGDEPSEVLVKADRPIELWATGTALIVRRGGEDVARVELAGSFRTGPGLGPVTFTRDAVTIIDPTTGTDLVTATAEELRRVAPLVQPTGIRFDTRQHVLLFTENGTEWSVQGLARFDDASIQRVWVFEDRVTLLVQHRDGYSMYESAHP